MTGMRHLELLLVEDNPGDAHLVRYELGGEMLIFFEIHHAPSLTLAVDALGRRRFDIIMLDLDLPDSAGLDTLDAILSAAPDIPVVVLTGRDDIEIGLKAMYAGAQDFLIKGHADGIQMRRSLLFAEHHKKTQTLLAGIQRQNEQLLKAVGDGIAGLDMLGRVTYMNPRLEFMTGWTISDLMLKSPDDVFHPLKMDESNVHHSESPISATLTSGHTHEVSDVLIHCKSGHLLPVDIVVTPIIENGYLEGAVVAYHDARDRHQALEILSHQMGFQQQVIDALPLPLFYLDGMDVLIGCNNAFQSFAGRSRHGLIGLPAQEALPQPIYEAVGMAGMRAAGKPNSQATVTIAGLQGGQSVLKLSCIYGKKDNIVGIVGLIDACPAARERTVNLA